MLALRAPPPPPCLVSLILYRGSGSFVADQSNVFVETALSYALQYVISVHSDIKIRPSSITILADNDYYSQQAAVYASSATSTSRFARFDTPIWKANKTGLGSSAALVTSLTGAILAFYMPSDSFSIHTDKGKRCLHNLAQAAHCAAQGKVGSGFDVASAVYGSCVYRRFSPSIIESIADQKLSSFAQSLRKVVEDEELWDVEITKSKVSVPKGLRLVMCDVDCGSKTPGMVKQVLQWRKQNPSTADRIWDELQATNSRLAAELVKLSNDESSHDYDTLRSIIQDNRKLVREMSKESEVPIEPEAQTKLLDACSQLEGVIGGVTPGAGGYDAVVLMIEDKPAVVTSLKNMLQDYEFEVKDVETVGSGRVGLLRVREEMEGVKEENSEDYSDWVGRI